MNNLITAAAPNLFSYRHCVYMPRFLSNYLLFRFDGNNYDHKNIYVGEGSNPIPGSLFFLWTKAKYFSNDETNGTQVRYLWKKKCCSRTTEFYFCIEGYLRVSLPV